MAEALDAVLVPGDDFFAAEITDAEWDALGPAERAAAAIDWQRMREEAIEPLLAGRAASWHPFDFAAGTRPDGTYPMATDAVTVESSAFIVVDGAYSCRPELTDLIDLAVLVDLPVDERHRRIAAREEASFSEAWHARWNAAEDYYFSVVRPPSSFDLVVTLNGVWRPRQNAQRSDGDVDGSAVGAMEPPATAATGDGDGDGVEPAVR